MLTCSYGDCKEVELQDEGKSQLQQKYSSDDKEPPLSGWHNVCAKIECDEGCRHESCNANDHPSEDFHGHNGEALQCTIMTGE